MARMILLVFVLALTQDWASATSDDAYAHVPTETLTNQWREADGPERESIEAELIRRQGEATGTLILRLQDGTPDEKLMACAMIDASDRAAIQALLDATDDGDRAVRIAAWLALGRSGSSTVVGKLRGTIAEALPIGELNAALAALGMLGDRRDLDLLRCYLGHEAVTVRVNAAAAMALLGSAEGEATLLAATHSDSPQAQREATYALGLLNSPLAERQLMDIVQTPDARWRTEAEIALETRHLRFARSEQEKSARLEALAESGNDGVAAWAREMLGGRLAAAKHATSVHGGGVGGNPDRSVTANAFAVVNSPGFTAAQREEVTKGTVDEDLGARPINHFYNPITGRNTMPFHTENALGRANRLWLKTLRTWNRGETAGANGAYVLLGRTMHLLQDMTSPAHVHDDPHVPVIDWDDFEVYGDTMYPEPSAIVPGLTPYVPAETVALPRGGVVPGRSVRGLMQAMAMFTYELTSFQGELLASSDPQPDSELTRMFPDGRVYYQEGGLLGGGYWYIDEVGRYGRVGNNAWWPCAGDHVADFSGPEGVRHIVGRFYIENAGGDHGDLTPAVFERPLTHLDSAEGMTFLDIYAGELYPESVRYCATLLQMFESATSESIAGGMACAASRPRKQPLKAAAGDLLLWAGIVAGIGLFRKCRR